MSKIYFLEKWKGRQIIIHGQQSNITTVIQDIVITSSVADFKNFNFLTHLESKDRIQVNDLIEIS